MCRVAKTIFRGLLAVVVMGALCGVGVVSGSRPANAQGNDASLDALVQEMEQAQDQYELVLGYANAATEERVARQQAGATKAEIRALKNREANLILRAQNLKVKADYLEETYENLKKKRDAK